jgi:hypothetical protein
MPYVAPAAVTSGAVISKTTFGDVVIADLNYFATPPACTVTHNAAQALTTGVEGTVAFNSETEDTDTMHDTVTNNSRITIKTAGRYVFVVNLGFASNNTGSRQISLRMNGATFLAYKTQTATQGDNTMMDLTICRKFAVNDYLEVRAFQSSGGNLNVLQGANYSPYFGAVWVGLG